MVLIASSQCDIRDWKRQYWCDERSQYWVPAAAGNGRGEVCADRKMAGRGDPLSAAAVGHVVRLPAL